MNILVISNLYPPNVFGGAEILTETLVNELRRRHTVTVLTSRADHEFGKGVLPELCLVKRYPVPLGFGIRDALFMLFTNPFNYFKTRSVLHRLKPDVVIVSDLKRLGFGPMIAAQEKFPSATILHDRNSFNIGDRPSSGLKGFLRRMFMKACFFDEQFVRFTLSNSETTRRLQHPRMKFGENRMVGVGIRPPADFDAIIRNNRKSAPGHRLIYVGRIEAQKGVHDIIQAAALLSSQDAFKDVELEIIGFENDPAYRSELDQLSSKLGLSERVKFLGRVTDEEKYARLAAADALVFASTWEEGHGQTYLEAMLCGVPCVCAPAGGAAEVLRDGENCLIFPSGDAPAIARACARLWGEPALRKRIAENARQMVQSTHTAEAFAGRCEKALFDCISSWNSASGARS